MGKARAYPGISCVLYLDTRKAKGAKIAVLHTGDGSYVCIFGANVRCVVWWGSGDRGRWSMPYNMRRTQFFVVNTKS